MPEPRHTSRHFVVGVLILLLGFVLLLDQLGFVEAGKVFLFWPLILIYFGLNKLLTDHNSVGRFWGGFLALLGVSFQLEELGFSYIRIGTIWPVFLICIGVLLIMRRYENRARWQDYTAPPSPAPDSPKAPSDVPPPIDAPPAGAVPPPIDAPRAGAVPPPFGGPPPGAGPQTQSNFAQDHAWRPGPGESWNDFGKRMDEFGKRMHDAWQGAGKGSRRPAGPWSNFDQRMDEFGQRMDQFGERMHGARQGAGHWVDSSESRLNSVNIFWGGRRRIISKSFVGGEIVSIFGGFEIDLRDADIQGNEACIEIVTLFGGGEIRVPANWDVVLDSVGIFGGASDRTRHPETPNQVAPGSGAPASPVPKRLVIKGVSIFGGLGVKN